MHEPAPAQDKQQAARRGVRRTVLVLVAVAVGIYLAFILSGVLR
ncbi:hypothetical protein [Cognatiluteimonas weifangensis]|nr:hypothetical protein [Luteimonas weifangensis]